MRELLYGRNPVYECLRAGRRTVHSLSIAEGVKIADRLAEIEALAQSRKIPVRRVPREQLEKLNSGSQGVALEAGAYPYASLEEINNRITASGKPPFLLVLDSLQDPQNLGTLIRTAEAVGVHGILIPSHQSAQVTPAVINASAGAAEHMRVAQLNLVQAMRELKDKGLWFLGLDQGVASRPAGKIDFNGPIALVVGSEGQGLRRLVRESCDWFLGLPMVGQVESLNAAIAGSIVLYEVFRARGVSV